MLISLGGYYHPAASNDSIHEQIRQAIFGAGQAGGMWLPIPVIDGQQILFQDAAMSVPVTGDSQPVRVMRDFSGNGNHGVAPSDAARWLYRTDGVRHWIQNDGTDDSMVASGIVFSGAAQSHHFVAAVLDAPPSTNGGLLQYGSGTSNSSRAIGFSTETRFKADAGSNSAAIEGFDGLQPQVYEARFGDAVYAGINGGAFNSSGTPTNTTSGELRIGEGVGGGFRTAHRNYGTIVVGEYVSGAGRTEAVQYLTDLLNGAL